MSLLLILSAPAAAGPLILPVLSVPAGALYTAGASAALADESNFIFVLKNDTAVIENNPGEKVSLFALDGAAHGITLEGFYYSLQNGTLYPFDPMGTSNYITAPQGKVTVKKGTLLIVISKENQ